MVKDLAGLDCPQGLALLSNVTKLRSGRCCTKGHS